MKRLVALLFIVAAGPLYGGTAYHLRMEVTPAAAFPFLKRFGTSKLDVYPGGVRADTFWLDGLSQNGAKSVTVINPLARMYTEVPIAEIAALTRKLAGPDSEEKGAVAPTVSAPANGVVKGIPAARYRLTYGATAFIDIWVARSIPENAQLRAIADQFVGAISPTTASSWRQIRGTPLYVELNFRRFKKVVLLRTLSLANDRAGEKDALQVGSFYMHAPLLDSLWK